MNKLITATSALLLLGLSTPSLANDWYVGANASKQKIAADTITGKDFSTLGLTAGYSINQYLSIEARYLSSINDDEIDVIAWEGQATSSYEIGNQINLLVKASYPIYQNLSAFAFSGYSDTKMTATLKYKSTNQVDREKRTFDGLTYGLGVNYQFDPKVSVSIEYQILPDHELDININDTFQAISQDWSSLNLGVTYTF